MAKLTRPDESGWDLTQYLMSFHQLQDEYDMLSDNAAKARTRSSEQFERIATTELEARKRVKELERENAQLLKELARATEHNAVATLQQTLLDLQGGSP